MPELKLFITNGTNTYEPGVQEEITWETSRQGGPGKLTFTVMKEGKLDFQEGNRVTLSVDGTNTFCGYVFTKNRSKDGLIHVTAYDQLRYLKNKDTLKYDNKKASEVIRMLADDFNLKCGELADTGYVIPHRLEDNLTLFDMIKNALDETLKAEGQMYVLYDQFGYLTLKNAGAMKLNVLISQETAEDFDYTSSIDRGTYTRVRLSYDNHGIGERDVRGFPDYAAMKRWGVLQYFETVDSLKNREKKGNALLQYYSRKTRNLSIRRAFGDIRVRGGSMVPVTLDLGDVVANTYMIVEKATHKLSGNTHFMDLTLIGGDFIA